MAVEAERGCGFRRVGNLYIVADGIGEPCHRVPYPLERCPTCDAGIKFSRGWTWIHAMPLLGICPGGGSGNHCVRCVVCFPPDEESGLLWVGEKHYATPEAFSSEANLMGVSKRIAAIPRRFRMGETIVYLAHMKACGPSLAPLEGCGNAEEPRDALVPLARRPGLFRAFRPTRLELILRKSDATPERVAEEAKRGVTVVDVPDGDPDHDPQGEADEAEDPNLF